VALRGGDVRGKAGFRIATSGGGIAWPKMDERRRSSWRELGVVDDATFLPEPH
jgi:hypothetical protein